MFLNLKANDLVLMGTFTGLLLTLVACTKPHQDNLSPANGQTVPVIGQPDDLISYDSKVERKAVLEQGLQAVSHPIDSLRNNALREAALVYGSQNGFKSTVQKITQTLELQSNNLSVVFDFGKVVTPLDRNAGYVIPPVVVRASNAVTINPESTVLASTDEFLTIRKPGRLSTTMPTWRDYLLIPETKIEPITPGLVPSDKVEHQYFTQWFNTGWQSGTDLGLQEFAIRLRRLKRDYIGMVDYRKLVSTGVINELAIANADFGVSGTPTSLRINNRLIHLVSYASFEANPQFWRLPDNNDSR